MLPAATRHHPDFGDPCGQLHEHQRLHGRGRYVLYGACATGHHHDLLQLCGLYRRRGVLWALFEAKQSADGACFFQGRFDSRRIQSLAGVSIVVGLTAYLLAVTWGMALIITEVTGFDETVAILMIWAELYLLYLYSGSRGVILTDTAMFLLFSGHHCGRVVFHR